MKRIVCGLLLSLFVSSLAVPAHSAQEKDRWKYLFTDPDGVQWQYDFRTISRLGDIVKVWLKGGIIRRSPAERTNQFKLMEKKQINEAMKPGNYNVDLLEVDCSQRKYRRLSSSIYDASGNMVLTKTEDPKTLPWTSPSSTKDVPFIDVCGIIKK